MPTDTALDAGQLCHNRAKSAMWWVQYTFSLSRIRIHGHPTRDHESCSRATNRLFLSENCRPRAPPPTRVVFETALPKNGTTVRGTCISSQLKQPRVALDSKTQRPNASDPTPGAAIDSTRQNGQFGPSIPSLESTGNIWNQRNLLGTDDAEFGIDKKCLALWSFTRRNDASTLLL